MRRGRTPPQRLLRLARDHWGIENRLHYVRDVAFAEDRCRVRAGARPLASLRNFAITLIRRAGLSISEALTGWSRWPEHRRSSDVGIVDWINIVISGIPGAVAGLAALLFPRVILDFRSDPSMLIRLRCSSHAIGVPCCSLFAL